MKIRCERNAILLEIIGMSLLVIATFWDSNFSGWWDNSSREMQYLIQEKANLAILEGIKEIASYHSSEGDIERQREILNTSYEKINSSIFTLIEERSERYKRLNGQAAFFSKIKLILLLSGACLVILGKIITFSLMKKN